VVPKEDLGLLLENAVLTPKPVILLFDVLVRTRHQIVMLYLGTWLRNALPSNGYF
jgi:hypothetical protein